jgi:hypothetical protein
MKFSELIDELIELSKDGFFTRDRIGWWLDKHKFRFKKLSADIDTLSKEFQDEYVRNHHLLQNEAIFLDTYEVLLKILECYKNEQYYKGQIEYYNKVKDDDLELSSWLQTHLSDGGEMQTNFNMLFQNTSTVSGYEFIIRYPFSLPVSIKFNESDFHYTLQFLSLLKK